MTEDEMVGCITDSMDMALGELQEYVKAVYCHPAYLTYMQNTS